MSGWSLEYRCLNADKEYKENTMIKNISDIISPEIMMQAKSADSAEQLAEIAATFG